MKLFYIKQAVDQGKPVYWKDTNYKVTKDKYDQYFIVCTNNDHAIGLFHKDGKTLNGDEEDFFVGQKVIQGNKEGQWFSEHNWNEINELAAKLIEEFYDRIEGDVTVFYDPKYDFHNIEIKLDGDTYIIRKYKVFGALKNPTKATKLSVFGYDSEYESKTFYFHQFQVVNFFRDDRHKSWPKHTPYVPEQSTTGDNQ